MQDAPHLTHELFLVLDRFPSRAARYRALLRVLSRAADEGPLLSSVDAFFRPDTDVALLAIRFSDPKSTGVKRAWIIDTVASDELPVLDPNRLSDTDRAHFYTQYLSHYPLRIESTPTPDRAIEELLALLARPTDQAAPRRSAPPAPAPADKNGVVIARQKLKTRARRASPPTLPQPAAGARPATPPPLPRPRGKPPRIQDRHQTVPGHGLAQAPGRALRARATTAPPPTARRLGSECDVGQDIAARFQRGETWFPARLRSLNSRGVRLATGAPPPVGAALKVALEFATHHVDAPAVVSEVTWEQGAGSNCFRASFTELDQGNRQQLLALLSEARRRGMVLAPPPPRRSARFPVFWPVTIETSVRKISAFATDLSAEGLFVATPERLEDREVRFYLNLEERDRTTKGRARVARQVTANMAHNRKLERGYGFEIIAIDYRSDTQFQEFLERVRQRSNLHVLVAASPDRIRQISAGLCAAGYLVSGTSDARDVVGKALFDHHRPDAVIIDASLDREQKNRDGLETLLSQQGVPCVGSGGNSQISARARVDRLLSVG